MLVFLKYLDGGSGFHFIFIFGIMVMPTWSSSTESYVLLPAYAKHVKPGVKSDSSGDGDEPLKCGSTPFFATEHEQISLHVNFRFLCDINNRKGS